MPYTEEQHKLFQAAAHNPDIAESHDLTMAKAAELASEGVKDSNSEMLDILRKLAGVEHVEEPIKADAEITCDTTETVIADSAAIPIRAKVPHRKNAIKK